MTSSKRSTLWVLILMLFCLTAKAQTFEYEEGFYLDKAGKKWEGLILYEGIKSQTSGIHFKRDSKSKSRFIRAEEIDFVDQKNGFDLIQYYDSGDAQYVLLSRIADGKIKLDAYENKYGSVYAFSKDSVRYPVQETKHSDKNWEHNRVKDLRYRGVLNILMNDSRSAKKQIPEVRFGYRGFRNIVDDYNRESNPTYVQKRQKIKTGLDVFVGININQSHFKHYTIYNGRKSAYEPGFTFGTSGMVRFHRKFRFRAGMAYTEFRASFPKETSSGSTIAYSGDIHLQFLDFPLRLDYFLIDRNVKLTANAGLMPGIAIKNQFLVTNYLLQETSQAEFPIRTKSTYSFGLMAEYHKYFIATMYYWGSGRAAGVTQILNFRGTEMLIGMHVF